MKIIGEFTIVETYDGQPGAQGPQGISVVKVVKEYTKSSSPTTIPNPPNPPWSETKPTIAANEYLWERERTDLDNNTSTYSNARCDVIISGIVFDVDKNNQAITSKIWQTDINSSINTYDGSTAQAIRDRVTATETNLSGITTRVTDVETTTDGLETRMSSAESEITQHATDIGLKVSKNGVIAAINASVEQDGGSAVKISADKVNIEGAAIFTSNGRLSETSLNNAYDSKGSASAAQSAAITSANSYTDNKTQNMATTTDINQLKANYGTCSTDAGTQIKVVTCANFELIAGNELTIKFSKANTYAAGVVQLNVNSKGAKNIWVGSVATSSSNQLLWGANAYITFKYDGTQFIVIGQPRSWYGASTTAAATAAKTDTTAITGCVICKGTKIELAMTNNNTNTSATLNIQSTGAKNIYYGNTTTRPTVDNGHSWISATTATFTFDGAVYRMAGQTVINGDNITTGTISANRIGANSITTQKLAADAIKSANYDEGPTNSPYSSGGTFLDLTTGNIYTPNFGVQSTTGQAYLNGQIIATSGTIGDDSGNYWSIGNTTDAQGDTSASIIGNGTAYIQDGDFQIHNGVSNYSKGSINTQWYITPPGEGLQITYPYYDNRYYDYGMTSPVLNTSDNRYYNQTVSQNFLYIRKSSENAIPTLASDWQYLFRVDKDGIAYVSNLYVNGTDIATMISNGVDGGAYLPTSGGTVNGDVTITGTLTATASNAINDSDGLQINTTYLKRSGGTMTGQIKKAGVSKSWHKGRDGALIFLNSINAYSTIASIKTTNGSWDIGHYNNSSYTDDLLFSYVTDTLYNGSTASTTAQIKFLENGHIVASGFDGNATSATTATKATQDASGNVITTTYAKINDTTLTGNTTAESLNSDEVIAGSLIVNGDATFVNTINGDISGNAATANSATTAGSLSSSGTIKVNLGSTSASTYTSGGNITPGISGTLPIGYGGTGKASWTQYGIVYASATNALSQIAVGTSGQVLTSKGSAAPAWTSQSDLSVGSATSATKDDSGNTISSYYAPKSTAVTNVAYDSTNTKLTKTINGTTSDIVTIATLKSAMSLNNVTNNKQVKGLSSGTTSGHLVTWGSDGYTVTDSGIAKGNVTTKITLSETDYSASSNTITITKANLQSAVSDSDHNFMSSAQKSKLDAIVVTEGGTIDFSNVTASGELTATPNSTTGGVNIEHNKISDNFGGTFRSVTVNEYGHVTAGTNPTTLSGYGITDAKIASGVITLGSNTITPLTADSTLAGGKVSGAVAEATKATKDGSGNTITSTYVKKAGDTMTGTLTIKPSTTISTNTPATIEFQITQTDNNITTNGNFIKVYDDHDALNYGGNMVIQSASGVVIGAGESPTAYYNNVMKDVTTEKLTLISDGSIEIFTNANTFANRKGITLNTSLNLYPQTTNTGSVGTSDNKWNAMYATTFYGALSGNASTATSLSTSGTIQTNLASTSSVTYTSGGNITPGVTGTLGIGNGGTGQTTAVNAANAFLSALPTWTADPTDTTYFIRQDTAGANSFGRLPFSTVWNYIKGKISSVDDIFVKLSGDQTIAGIKTFSSQIIAQSGIAVNTTSGTAGGISLYATNPTNYGIAMRQTSNSGLHGYVQGDWAIYSYMNGSNTTNKLTRGWIFKNVADNIGVASISGAGNAVFNGSVTVGGNTGNTSGARMEFNSTNNCIDFIFN